MPAVNEALIWVSICRVDFSELADFDMEAARQSLYGKKVNKVKNLKPPVIVKNRYPKRNIPATNYADIEVPDDDHYLCKCSHISFYKQGTIGCLSVHYILVKY